MKRQITTHSLVVERNMLRGGFSRTELLVLIVLVVFGAILAAVLTNKLPSVVRTQKQADIEAAYRESADIDATRSQLGLFKSPLEMYAMDLNTYPTTEQGLKALYECPEDIEKKELWKGPYLDEEPPQDPWGQDYQYEYPATKGKKDFPDIWSLGPDKEDGSEDDIVNWKEEDEEAPEE